MSATKRIEVYMKSGAAGVSTSGAVVRLESQRTIADNILTRLTGGSVLELEVEAYYLYEFNVVGNGKFTLAVLEDGETLDLEWREFETADARRGTHRDRSFAFKVMR